MTTTLVLSGQAHKTIYRHLFPGDGLEAIAVAICGRSQYLNENKILIHEIILIPYDECDRREGLLTWSTNRLAPFFEMIMNKNMAIVKIHSHPGGYDRFSETDDKSDQEFFQSVYGWSGTEDLHASAVMLPNGTLFGRSVSIDGQFDPLEKIILVGDEIRFWWARSSYSPSEFALRTKQAFGQGTTELLGRLKIGVVGCSGTGSPVIEQLVRLGVGKLVLVDPDTVEKKNLNRILNTTLKDAEESKLKVNVLAKAILEMNLGTQIEIHAKNLFDESVVVQSLASCDVLFGCLDSIDGRHLLNQLASFYLVPYFDLGIRLTADGNGGIEQILGTVHYIQPCRGSLLTRGVYTGEGLRAAGLTRSNPQEYEDLRRSGYIINASVHSPAVISVNMLAASLAINEFLARIHNFRNDDNDEYEINRFSLTDGYFYHEKDETVDNYLKKFAGRGDMKPLLNMPELSNK
jgi:hypothetical protein